MIGLQETKTTLDNTQLKPKLLSVLISMGNSDFKIGGLEVVMVEAREVHPMITSYRKLKKRQTTTTESIS